MRKKGGRGKQLTISVPPGIYRGLEKLSRIEGSNPTSFSNTVLTQYVRNSVTSGVLSTSDLEEVLESEDIAEQKYESFAEIVMHNYTRLHESGKFEIKRLQELMSGEAPTETELLRVALIGKVSEDYAINLSQKKGNGQHGSNSTKRSRT